MYRKIRFILFFLAILAGIAGGLYYGWVINPQGVRQDSLPALRADYRTDAVLMVAEGFAGDQNAVQAAARLNALGDTPPVRLVQLAIISGRDLGYSNHDIELLARLSQAMQTLSANAVKP